MATFNIVNLVKEMLPDAIKRTERDTFVYAMDGEEQVFPSYRTAAHALGTALGLGKRHVASEEIEKRIGKVTVVYTAPIFDARNMQTPPPVTHSAMHPAAPATGAARQPRQSSRAHQPRSVRVTLPQSAVSELLRNGRVRILLAVK